LEIREDDYEQVTPARLATVCGAVAAALCSCTAAHRLPTQARVESVPSATVRCPAYAALGPDGQPAVPLATVVAQRLAPEQTPTQLVLCRYRGSNVLQLTGSRQVRVGLATAGSELASSPRSMGGPVDCATSGVRHTPYLIGLRYPSGVLWVTTAYDVNGCQVTSNGTFASDAHLGGDADQAFTTGVWSGGTAQLDCRLTTPGCG